MEVQHMKNNIKERFVSSVEMVPECGCWIWTKCCDRDGYGKIKIKRKLRETHRVSWEIYRGLIPKNLCVLHSCDTPCCVNPHHLFLGTRADNAKDCMNKNRQAYGGRNSQAKLTESQVANIRNDTRKQTVIAINYGISQCHVSEIKRRVSWKHIECTVHGSKENVSD